MRPIRTLATGLLLGLLACTYRTELLASNPAAGNGGHHTGGSATMPGHGGTAGTGTGGAIATGGTTSTGGSAVRNDRSCTSDDDCVQCLYISTPSNPDECSDLGLGCCGGQVMNQTACATNETAWHANCSNGSYAPFPCPCIVPCGDSPTCKNGECGFWCY